MQRQNKKDFTVRLYGIVEGEKGQGFLVITDTMPEETEKRERNCVYIYKKRVRETRGSTIPVIGKVGNYDPCSTIVIVRRTQGSP